MIRGSSIIGIELNVRKSFLLFIFGVRPFMIEQVGWQGHL